MRSWNSTRGSQGLPPRRCRARSCSPVPASSRIARPSPPTSSAPRETGGQLRRSALQRAAERGRLRRVTPRVRRRRGRGDLDGAGRDDPRALPGRRHPPWAHGTAARGARAAADDPAAHRRRATCTQPAPDAPDREPDGGAPVRDHEHRQAHMRHLYAKLDVTTRGAAVERSRELGLLGSPTSATGRRAAETARGRGTMKRLLVLIVVVGLVARPAAWLASAATPASGVHGLRACPVGLVPPRGWWRTVTGPVRVDHALGRRERGRYGRRAEHRPGAGGQADARRSSSRIDAR